MNNDTIGPFLRELADIAASRTLPHFRNLENVENKKMGGFDPVTRADKEAESAIREAIENRFPDHGIEGEEFGSHQPDAKYRWVIDPVDGTRSFLAGVPLWGTLIALCENGRPIAGIMSQPYTGEIFLAQDGASVFERGGTRVPISTSRVSSLDEAIIMSTAPELFGQREWPLFQRLIDDCRLVRYGTDCYAYCMLAAGQIELVVEPDLNFYDVAALIPIIENAGGVVSQWDGSPFTGSGHILASANVEIHAYALRILSAYQGN